jgi:SAM-dependent methyltransferase
LRSDLYRNLAEVESRHWWFRARRRVVEAFLEGRLATGCGRGTPRILDVGAGTGHMTRALTRFGEVEALEGAPEALEWLRTREGITVHEGVLPGSGLQEERYDLVTAFDVLEHIADDEGALAEIHRLTVPSGLLLVTVPAHPSLWSEWDVAHHHQRRYRPRALERRVMDAGFELLFSSPMQTLLFPAFVLERLVRRLRPERDGALVVRVPPPVANRALEAVFALERHWLRRGWRSPMGSSHLLLARRLSPPRHPR